MSVYLDSHAKVDIVLHNMQSSIGGTRHIQFFCWLGSGEAR